jgi:hypothetical protein
VKQNRLNGDNFNYLHMAEFSIAFKKMLNIFGSNIVSRKKENPLLNSVISIASEIIRG